VCFIITLNRRTCFFRIFNIETRVEKSLVAKFLEVKLKVMDVLMKHVLGGSMWLLKETIKIR